MKLSSQCPRRPEESRGEPFQLVGGDHLIIGDPAALDLHPMAKVPTCGVDQTATVAIRSRARFDKGRLGDMLLQFHHRGVHLLKQRHGPVESRELPQPCVRALLCILKIPQREFFRARR
jgi:hypothetical protein